MKLFTITGTRIVREKVPVYDFITMNPKGIFPYLLK
jgi:hypothetical protein